jgi:hypothetical protein
MWVAVAVIGPLAVLAALREASEPEVVRAAGLGAALAGLNTIVAYALVLWSQGRQTKAFMGAVLGGMLGRMAFLLSAVAFSIGVLELPRIPLVVALLGYFVFFLVLELGVLNRRPAVEVL